MRRGLALAGAAALLLGLALALALVLPGRLDWDGYRPALAEHASQRLGRPIGLNGGLRLRLLPQTVLEADGLTIGSADDGVELTARALRLRLDPWRLLLGRVVVREVVLVGADIRLPWPPARLPGLGTLGDLTLLDARLEDSRISVAGARIEGVSARLLAGGLAEALLAEGRFNWRGQPLSFNATLGRAGDDGVAPLDITGQISGARVSARGTLLAAGGFEGRLEAAGPDLSALLPTPRGAFTATGRITAMADLVGVDQLALDLAGQQARGGISLRLAPDIRLVNALEGRQPGPPDGRPANPSESAEPRLDAALLASRLDLDAWTEALRRSGSPALPIGLDLSAEQAGFRGMALRRLRLAVQLENGRILVPEASAELPGSTTINASGAGTANASEWALRFNTRRLPEALAGIGIALPEAAMPPGPASGTMRLVLDERQAAFSDVALSLDGSRVAGTATWRWGERPLLGLGLDFARLDLDPWLEAGERLAALDINLRLAAERATLRGLALEALNLDASAEGGRLVLRRLLARHGGADVTASANGTLSPPRVNEAALELQGSSLGAMLGGLVTIPGPSAALPARLRASLSGPLDALQLRAEAAVEDARLEAQLAIDAGPRRATGTLTLRHPGARRLLGPLLGPSGRDWLGEGSLAIIAAVNLRPGLWAADNLDIVAGQLRLRGPASLNREGARPRLAGQFTSDLLALPPPGESLPFALLGALDMELSLRAENLAVAGLPRLTGVRAGLRLGEARLALELEEARLAGGALRGVLRLDAQGATPGMELEARLEGAVVSEALLGRPELPDIATGRADAALALRAQGHGPAAWRASLTGEGEVELREGRLLGVDQAALLAAAALPLEEAPERLRAALEVGNTPFLSLSLPFTAADGLLRLGEARLLGEAGEASLAGVIDLARDALDLRLLFPRPEGPPLSLWLGGRLDAPRRLPEIAAHLRWRSERE